MGLLYLGGPTIQEVGGEIMMGLSIYRVAVIDGSLYSRFYGIPRAHYTIQIMKNIGLRFNGEQAKPKTFGF